MRLTPTDPDQEVTQRVAAEIRAEIARQGMTRAAFASQIGWTQQRLSLRLTGQVAFTVPELFMFAATLGVPVAKLLPAEVPA